MKTVVIFGGSGFIGQHIIRRIAKIGYRIIIPHQQQTNEAKLRLLGVIGQIIPLRFRSFNETIIQRQLQKANVVINLKTLWDEKKISFKDGIFNFNKQLVNVLVKMNNNKQFIYFSGLDSDAKECSKRSEMIFRSENYIQKYLSNSIIIKPGVIVGGGDRFMKALLPLFKISFFIPLFGSGKAKFQPVFIDDISIAVNKIIIKSIMGKHTFELVGPEIFTYKDFYNYLAVCLDCKRFLVPVPLWIVKIGISILEKTPICPINSEQLKLFERDNVSSNRYKKFSDLSIEPQNISEKIKKIIEKNN